MPVTRHPPHRPVLALLTHTVLTSDAWRQTAQEAKDAEFPPREGGTESLRKTLPRPTATLTPPSKLVQPHALHLVAERLQACLVVRYGVVLKIPANHRAQPLRRIRNRRVHPLAQRLPNILQLGGHPFAYRLAVYREVPLPPAPPTNVGETQKVEGLRLPFPTLLPALGGISPEFDQTSFIRVPLQSEFPHPLPQLLQESFCIASVLKSQHSVVGIPHDDHVTLRHLLPPYLGPDIEHIMQVEIGKYRRDHRPLRSPFLRLEPPAFLHHARLQPFPDQAHDPSVCDPMLDKPDHPIVFDFSRS